MGELKAFIRLCVLTAVILTPRFAIGQDREKKSKPPFSRLDLAAQLY